MLYLLIIAAGLFAGALVRSRLVVGFAAVLIAPWTAVATVVRQQEAFARNQTLAFALERSKLERQALDARLHLPQAPHCPARS